MEAKRNSLKLLARNADNNVQKKKKSIQVADGPRTQYQLSLQRKKPWMLAILAFAIAQGSEWVHGCSLYTLGRLFARLVWC